MRVAASTCDTPRGSRNSFRSISPGWVGGRWVGSIDIASVVISAAYIERVTAFETEHDSILIVHAHGVQPSHATDLSRSSRSASGMLRFGMRPV